MTSFDNDASNNRVIDPFAQREADDAAAFERDAQFHPRTQAWLDTRKPKPEPERRKK